jgi:hypothetical protein
MRGERIKKGLRQTTGKGRITNQTMRKDRKRQKAEEEKELVKQKEDENRRFKKDKKD